MIKNHFEEEEKRLGKKAKEHLIQAPKNLPIRISFKMGMIPLNKINLVLMADSAS